MRTAVRGTYAAATAVNADTVEPTQRLLERHTAGQAILYFMLSEASLTYTYDSAIGKRKS